MPSHNNRPSALLSLPPEILKSIINLTCPHQSSLVHSAHPCDIFSWCMVHPRLAAIASPILWRRVYLSTRERAERLMELISAAGGHDGRVGRSILSIRVEYIGSNELGDEFVPQPLVTQIVQNCPGLLRLDAPMTDLQPAVSKSPYLTKLRSLTLLDIPKVRGQASLGIAAALASPRSSTSRLA